MQYVSRRALKPCARAFSLVETTIAIVMVGGLYIVALNLVGASQIHQTLYIDRDQGVLLAEALMAEVLAQDYADRDDNMTFGVEADEDAAQRDTFDDVDDYDGWVGDPPVAADDTAIPGADRYTRSVSVAWVRRDNPKFTDPSDTGIKRVVVTVRVGGEIVTRLVGFAAEAWPDADDMAEPIR